MTEKITKEMLEKGLKYGLIEDKIMEGKKAIIIDGYYFFYEGEGFEKIFSSFEKLREEHEYNYLVLYYFLEEQIKKW